jgi:hypothetical protein
MIDYLRLVDYVGAHTKIEANGGESSIRRTDKVKS